MTPSFTRPLRRCLALCLAILAFVPFVQAAEQAARTWHKARLTFPECPVFLSMAEPIEYSEVRMRRGDDPEWAQPGFEDGHWRVIARRWEPAVARFQGVRWLRFHVRWNSRDERLPNALHLQSLLGAYEVYWDGVLVGSNGHPADTASAQIDGKSQSHFTLSAGQTTPGDHLVAIRFSTWHASGYQSWTYLTFVVMSQAAFDAMFFRDNMLPMIAVGVLMTLAIASLVMWLLAARRRVLLAFAGLCLSSCAMQSVYWFTIAYTYPIADRFGFDVIKAGCGLVLGLCLALIAVEEWNLRRGPWWMLAILLPADAVVAVWKFPDVELFAEWFIAASFAFVLGAGAWAAIRRRPNVWVIAAPVTLSEFLLWRDFYHFIGLRFFQGFLPTILGLMVAIALRIRSERRQAQQLKLTAARLQIELLKKNLQPHFLMNTLTALAQTVEEAPASAVKLIDDLAQEFRTLARMAGEKTVVLAEELELCRAHLRVMQARTDVPWRLEAEGVNGAAIVPPAMFLTLIENGFSHQRPRRGDTVFSLRALGNGRSVRYTFRSPGEVTAETNRAAGGTGLRYVRARLEESFPGAWSLTQGEANGGWQTEIELGGATPSAVAT